MANASDKSVWTSLTHQGYRSSMLKSYSQTQISEGQRKYWLDAKAKGKTRFILREAIGTILLWLIVLPSVQVFANHKPLFSLQFVVIWISVLPIFLLGGYLTGSWRWKDLERKYPE
jgi:hypothetical protein